tara:strand:+ start:12645 stop:13271 length:627 start_codon:yes stop_codon:yes gene_type:complete
MAILKWVFWLTIWAVIAAFFHYTLPQVDIVRITDTYEKRIDFGNNSIFWSKADVGNNATLGNRDVFFIQTRRAKGDVMVYRNEDTGWGWPPYFKFDTTNLQAEASDLKSSSASPQYVALKHYGWRNEFFSIFPNATSMWVVDGPNASKGIPFGNIIILTLFAATAYAIWVRWRRFKRSRIDPTVERIEDDFAERQSRFSSWMKSRRKK